MLGPHLLNSDEWELTCAVSISKVGFLRIAGMLPETLRRETYGTAWRRRAQHYPERAWMGGTYRK